MDNNIDLSAVFRKIVGATVFRRSATAVQLLEYLIKETEAGRGPLIKEQTIGIDVFKKEAGYDSGSDATVRTEISRLRKRLDRYYDEEGAEDPLRLKIPRGSYVPMLTPVRSRDMAQSVPDISNQDIFGFKPFFVIQPIKADERNSHCCLMARNFFEEFHVTAVTFRQFHIIAAREPETVPSLFLTGRASDLPEFVFIFSGYFKEDPDRCFLYLSVRDFKSQVIIWEKHYPLEAGHLRNLDFTGDLSQAIAACLLSENGILMNHIFNTVSGRPGFLDFISAQALFNIFVHKTLSRFHCNKIYRDLLRLNEIYPSHPRILGLLSRSCWLAYGLEFDEIEDAGELALSYGMQALSLNPESSDSLIILGSEAFHSSDVGGLRDILKYLTTNTSDRIYSAGALFWMNYMAKPDKRILEQLREAADRMTNPPRWFFMPSIIDCIINKKFNQLKLATDRFYYPGIALHYIFRLIVHSVNKDYTAAEREVQKIKSFVIDNLESYTCKYIKDPAAGDFIMEEINRYI